MVERKGDVPDLDFAQIAGARPGDPSPNKTSQRVRKIVKPSQDSKGRR
jgi:hypothetical protein